MAEKLGTTGGKGRGRGRASPPAQQTNAPAALGSVPGHNDPDAILEAERTQFVSFLSRIGAAKKVTAEAKATHDAAKKNETELFNLAKAAGFQRQELEAVIKDMGARNKDLLTAERRRRRHREWAGLPNGADEQLDMFDRLPNEEQDRQHWKMEGYRAGLNAGEGKPPKECHPRFHNDFMESYHVGQRETAERVAASMVARSAAAAPAAEEQGDGFEASAAELEGQITRQNVQAVRESLDRLGSGDGEDDGEDDGAEKDEDETV